MSSEGRFIPLEFKPGLFRDPTEYAAEGYWYDGDRIRFKKGLPQSIGGWQKLTQGSFLGTARQAKEWALLDSKQCVAYGTDNHFYIWHSGSFYNITPVSVSTNFTDKLSTLIGSTSVIVSINTHGRAVGDYFDVISQATTVGGNVKLDGGTYEVTGIDGANSFSINSLVTATGTSIAAGGVTSYIIPIHSGNTVASFAFGWGRSTWGSGKWGTPVSTGVIQALRLWSVDNWGEDLIFNYRGGPLNYWDATNGFQVRANVLVSSPSIVDYSYISFPARHVVAVGTVDASSSAYDPLLVRWSSSGDYNDWTVSALGTAGEYRIPSGSKVYGLHEAKSETMIWTDDAIWSMKYVGEPYWFGFDKLAGNCQLLSPMAPTDVGGTVFWMGHGNFFKYDGQVTPLQCTLQKDIFTADGLYAIDMVQREKTFCGTNDAHGEVIWLYQSIASTTGEVDRYVIYNYVEDIWYWGSIERTTWLDVSIIDRTLATGTDGYIYSHELGLTADNAPLDSFIESAPFDLEDGDKLLFVDRIVPDFSLTGSIAISFTTREYPNAPEVIKGPYIVEPSTRKIDIRARGRQAKIKVEENEAGSAWKLGKNRIRIRDNGKQ